MDWQSRTLISWLRAHLPLTGKRAFLGKYSSHGRLLTSSNSSSKLSAFPSPTTSSTLSAVRSHRLARNASSGEAVNLTPPSSPFATSPRRFSSRRTSPSRPNAAAAMYSIKIPPAKTCAFSIAQFILSRKKIKRRGSLKRTSYAPAGSNQCRMKGKYQKPSPARGRLLEKAFPIHIKANDDRC